MVRVVLLVLVVAVSAAGWLLHGAAKIGVGYSAKQLCSGVFVSDLPAEFVLEHDILPRMATVAGMDRFVKAEVGARSATVKILTASATASYRDRYGCTLHGIQASTVDALDAHAERDLSISAVRSDNQAVESAIDALFEEPETGGKKYARRSGYAQRRSRF
ncbi:hypothetical protein N9393_01805 [Luminiphilus sp.]|nr:hypothetical protein [Luminiphilus sp.]